MFLRSSSRSIFSVPDQIETWGENITNLEIGESLTEMVMWIFRVRDPLER
ncbi:hypothetical protein NB700_001765 [Xanthomonas sacchari]|uniref:Transposase n=1 Tax=Xanthomonas sacchari TaxID=56458 RepID=A0ABT3DVA9_9XANT|nr:hypothetical protein [Xanthomonas sacchari]